MKGNQFSPSFCDHRQSWVLRKRLTTKLWPPKGLYCVNCTRFGQLILRKSLKVLPPDVTFLGWNAPNSSLHAAPPQTQGCEINTLKRYKSHKILRSCSTCSECRFTAVAWRNKLTAKANRAELENVVKMWLRYAADRNGGRHGLVVWDAKRRSSQRMMSKTEWETWLHVFRVLFGAGRTDWRE